MAPTLYKLHSPRFRKRIAAFDYDWTLVRPKTSGTFPKNVDDWQWLMPSVPETLAALYKKGFMIVIFTNQSKDWKEQQILKALEPLEIPMFVAIARDKADYKPSRTLFDTVVKGKAWDNKESFFVGDALGRAGDWSDSDKVFADTIGLSVHAPEAIFPAPKKTTPKQKAPSPVARLGPANGPEVVIMVGYPGSGKTTVAEKAFAGATHKYIVLHGDDYKTSKKMIKAAAAYVDDRYGIVFDATNPTREKRAEYIAFARENGYPVRCVHVDTPLEESFARNMQREETKRVPRIAYNVYKKRFETPDASEGCEVITLG